MVGEDEYITSDLGEAAFLSMIMGFPQEFDRRNPNRVFFVFKGDKQFLEMKVADYHEGKGKFKMFMEMVKSLKSAISPSRNTK